MGYTESGLECEKRPLNRTHWAGHRELVLRLAEAIEAGAHASSSKLDLTVRRPLDRQRPSPAMTGRAYVPFVQTLPAL